MSLDRVHCVYSCRYGIEGHASPGLHSWLTKLQAYASSKQRAGRVALSASKESRAYSCSVPQQASSPLNTSAAGAAAL
jgi:hypothetical protein